MIIVFEDLRIVVEFGSVLFHPPAVVGLFVHRFAPLELDRESDWMPSLAPKALAYSQTAGPS
jgi:hypothetical protein